MKHQQRWDRRRLAWLAVAAVWGMAVAGVPAGVLYVATNGVTPHDGAGWATAMTNAQAALDAAGADDTLYLAGHTFDLGAPLIWSNKNLTVLGGYAATNTAETPGPRDPDLWPTVLQREAAAATEYRVLHIHGLTEGTLDGVVIRNGHAPTLPNYEHGGGLLIVASTNLAIRNCVIRENWINADYCGYGAGLAAIDSSLAISNIQVIANSIDRTRNNIPYFGGGMYLTGGSSTVRDSLFRENLVAGGAGMIGYGSGIFISGGTHSLTNLLLVGNRFDRLSGGHRGALAMNAGTVTARNISVLHNYGTAMHRITAGTLNIGSSIVWGNGATPVGVTGFDYSNVQGGVPAGDGNLSEDPLFERGIYLATNSPCVDAGGISVAAAGLTDYTTRADGTVDTGTVDMGYHFKNGLSAAVADLYVSTGGSDAHDGSGPADEDAFRTVTHALSVAQNGSRIHIGVGTFDVSGGESFPLVLDAFGLQLLGAGADQTTLDAGSDSNRVVSAHLVMGDGVIRDLTVTGGRSDAYTGVSYYAGGGILADNCAMLIDRVHVVSNRLDAGFTGPGAGIAAVNGGMLTLRDSVIAHNYLKGNRNDIDYTGAGLYVAGVPSLIERVVVFDNTLQGAGLRTGSGAGVYLGAGSHDLSNLLIASNRLSNLSNRFGVGLFSAATAVTLDRITLADNSGGDGIRRTVGTFSLSNSIVWNNTTELTAVSSDDLAYSIIMNYSPIPAQGISSNDPLFADRLHYHLQSQEGHYTGGWFSEGSWTTAAADSPGVDAGDPAVSWDDEPYPHAGRLNVGAYAGSTVAAKSPPLSVAVLDPTAVTPDSAMLQGELLEPGGSGVEYRFYYGTNDGGAGPGGWTLPPTALTAAPGDGQLSAVVSNLTTGIQHYYRVYAEIAEGFSAWSPTVKEFTPSLAVPVLGELSVSNPMGPSVTLHADIVSTGGDTPHGFVFWGATDGGTNAQAWDTTIDLGVTAGPIEETIATLAGSNYWFTIMVSNAAGVVWADYARPFGYYNRLFVAADADGRQTGYNWPDALPSLAAAFAACDSGRTNQIYLKGGADAGIFVAKPNPFRWDRSFVHIYGGYQGTVETGDGPRDPETWPTVLTRNPASPSIRILEIVGITNGILDGVTVTGGHADPWVSYAPGGGMMISNCVNLLLHNVTVTNNLLDGLTGGSGTTYTGRGAGMATFASSVMVSNSLFAGNKVQGRRNDVNYYGGGIYVEGGQVSFREVVVFSNVIQNVGGMTGFGAGVYLGSGMHDASNMLIAANRASNLLNKYGVGLTGAGDVPLDRVTVADNVGGEGIRRQSGSLTIRNSLVWDNQTELVALIPDDIWYSIVKDYTIIEGQGVSSNDPLFADRLHYHLQSEEGHVTGGWFSGGSWTTAAADSPGIDAGDPAVSWSDEPYPHGGRLNIGAYAGHATAAKSPPLTVAVLTPSGVAPESATLRGELVSPGGSDVEYRFYYGTSDAGANTGGWSLPPTPVTAVPQNGILTAEVDGLTAGTPCFYRVLAFSEGYSAWSPTAMTFTPQLSPPVLGDLSVSNPMGPSVTLHAEIASTGGETPVVIVYWGSSDGGTVPAAWDTAIDVGLTNGPIEQTITTQDGLNYWFTVMASNSQGVVWADYAVPFGYHKRIFVAADASGSQTGYNWPDAVASLPAALDACDPGRTNIIHLKGGPDGGVFIAQLFPFRWEKSFVHIYGGYEGTAAVGDGPRDPQTWPTVLTRKLSDPSMRIMEIAAVTNGILDGVTVTGGHADPWTQYASGGGLLIEDCVNLMVANVIVTNNLLDGQTYNVDGSSYTGRGAGMAAFNSSLVVSNSLVVDNFLRGRRNDIDYHGAGIYINGGQVVIDRCMIVSNRMVGDGLRTARGAGIACVNGGSHRVRNALIATNTMASFSAMQGQGITVQDAATAVTVENVTVADNEREGIRRVSGTLGITNTIVWGHTTADLDGVVSLAYSCVGSGGDPGNNGNIDDDPLFVDPSTGDYRLKTQYGRRVGQDWIHDAVTSPAIDTGTNLSWIVSALDVDGNPRLARGIGENVQIRVDMGAYEMQARPRGSLFMFR